MSRTQSYKENSRVNLRCPEIKAFWLAEKVMWPFSANQNALIYAGLFFIGQGPGFNLKNT